MYSTYRLYNIIIINKFNLLTFINILYMCHKTGGLNSCYYFNFTYFLALDFYFLKYPKPHEITLYFASLLYPLFYFLSTSYIP